MRFVIVAVCLFAGISFAQVVPPAQPVTGSVWGGVGTNELRLDLHFSLVTGKPSKKSGEVEFPCAHGAFKRAVVKAGGFYATGTFTREHGGPIKPDEKADTQAAKYFGYVYDNNKMTLIIALEKDPENPMVFNLEGGVSPLLHKCL